MTDVINYSGVTFPSISNTSTNELQNAFHSSVIWSKWESDWNLWDDGTPRKMRVFLHTWNSTSTRKWWYWRSTQQNRPRLLLPKPVWRIENAQGNILVTTSWCQQESTTSTSVWRSYNKIFNDDPSGSEETSLVQRKQWKDVPNLPMS